MVATKTTSSQNKKQISQQKDSAVAKKKTSTAQKTPQDHRSQVSTKSLKVGESKQTALKGKQARVNPQTKNPISPAPKNGPRKNKTVKEGAASVATRRIEGETICREIACEGLATSGDYCRIHYIKNWKKIKRKELILKEKKLNHYIEEIVVKYPDKYLEAIRQDLASDKDFAKVIYDLDLDEGREDFDLDGADSVDSLIDTIKRDFDDEGDVY